MNMPRKFCYMVIMLMAASACIAEITQSPEGGCKSCEPVRGRLREVRQISHEFYAYSEDGVGLSVGQTWWEASVQPFHPQASQNPSKWTVTNIESQAFGNDLFLVKISYEVEEYNLTVDPFSLPYQARWSVDDDYYECLIEGPTGGYENVYSNPGYVPGGTAASIPEMSNDGPAESGCSSCSQKTKIKAGKPGDFRITIRLGGPSARLEYAGNLGEGDLLSPTYFTPMGTVDQWAGVEVSGTLNETVTITTKDWYGPDRSRILSTTAVSQTKTGNRVDKLTVVVTPGDSTVPPTTHSFSRVISGVRVLDSQLVTDVGYDGFEYTRQEGGITETLGYYNAGADPDLNGPLVGAFQTKDQKGDKTKWTTANPSGLVVWQNGSWTGTYPEQIETTPGDTSKPKVKKDRKYARIGTQFDYNDILASETTTVTQPDGSVREESVVYGYEDSPDFAFGLGVTNNPNYKQRVWEARSDGTWRISLIKHEPDLLNPDAVIFTDQVEVTPWLDGPSGKPASFGKADDPAGTRAYMDGLVDDLVEGSYTLAATRLRVVTDRFLQPNIPAQWKQRAVLYIKTASGAVTPHGVEYDYMGIAGVFADSGLGWLNMGSRSERWNAAHANGAGLEDASVCMQWNATYAHHESGYPFHYLLTLDQSYTGSLTFTDLAEETEVQSWRLALRPAEDTEIVDGRVPGLLERVASHPIWRSSIKDQRGRTTSEVTHYSGATEAVIQSISTAYAGEHDQTRTSGSTVLASHTETFATEDGIQTRTTTDTDAQGITTITKTNKDTGELIAEIKKGVPALNGYADQLDLTTLHTKTVSTTANSAQGIAIGDTTQTVTQTDGSSTRTLSITLTDTLGRVKRLTDQLGRVTSYDYSADGRTTTETLPGGLERVTTTYLDGQLKSITGTAVVPEFHDYTVNDGTNADYEAGSITETVWTGWDGTGTAPPEAFWRKTTTNFLGWVLMEEESMPNQGRNVRGHTYNAKGQRVSTQDYGAGLITYFEYDDWGNLKRQTRDEQVVETETTYVVENNIVLEKTTQTQGEGPAAKTTTTRRTLTEGSSYVKTTLPDGRSTLTYDHTERAAQTRQEFMYDASGNVTVLLGTRTWRNGRLVQEQAGGTQGPVTILGYDGMGQMTSRNDPASGLSTWAYDPTTGQLLTETPAGGSAITYTYHPATAAAAGRLASRTANGAVTRYAYHDLGGLSHQWGNGTQSLKYEYDLLGRLTGLHIYKQAPPEWDAATSTPAMGEGELTQWEYYPRSLLVYRKIIDSTTVAEYTYDSVGRVVSMQQAATNPTARTYGSSGSLQTISSSGTPTVTYTYHPDGSVATVSDAAGLHRFTTDPTTGLTTETIEKLPGGGGLLAGIAITRKQTSEGRPLTVEAHCFSQSGGSVTYHTTLARHQYEWTPEGRLHRVYTGARDTGAGGPGHAYEYQWENATGRLGGILSRPLSSAPAGLHGADRHYVYTAAGGRVDELYYNTRPLTASGPGRSVLGYDYTHDAHGRRQRVQPYLPDAGPPLVEQPPGWEWAYNDRGEVENAARFTAVGGPVNGVVPSQTRAYSYDRMGNRLSLTQGSGAEAITHQTPFQFINKSQQPLRIIHGRKLELTGAVAAAASASFRVVPPGW